MTLEEAKKKYPGAAVVENLEFDTDKVLSRKLVIPAKAPGEVPKTVWVDQDV